MTVTWKVIKLAGHGHALMRSELHTRFEEMKDRALLRSKFIFIN
jgi:hypothetical protein